MLLDLRHALRQLAKNPGFTAAVVLILGLGIGANTGAFSVLNALLLHVPPYPQSEALVRVYRAFPQGESGAHSPANFLDIQAGSDAFTELAAVRAADFNLGEPGQPAERLRGMGVNADFFPLLRVAPELGRAFTRDEDRPGAAPVIVLSHALWQRRFGGDPGVIGRTIQVDGSSATVVGIMPAAFDDALLWGQADAWRPAALPDASRADRDNTYLSVIGRLKPGVTREQAQARTNALCARLAQLYPAVDADFKVRLVPLARSAQDPATRRIAWLVAGLAASVLLIACANLANLQFARQAARLREHAIRAALGASRAQRMRIVLTESAVLSLAGGAAGLLLAGWTNAVASHSFMLGEGVPLRIPLDGRVLAFTFAISILTGIGFGLLPAWLAAKADVGDALKQGRRGSTSGAQPRLRHGLIVAEIALALTLLVGAGLFARGLQRVLERDAGWLTDEVVTASLSLRGQNYATTAARGAFFRRLEERLKALPGVEQAAIATSVPTAGFDTGNSFVVEGRPPPPPGGSPEADVAAVTPGYFAALGMHLEEGRDFTDQDDAGHPAAVVINETMARHFWPGESALGKRIGGATPYMGKPRVVIGVVSDVRAAATLDDHGGKFQFYRSLGQWSFNSATIVLRGRLAPEGIAAELRGALAGVDRDQAVSRVDTVRREIDQRLRPIEIAGRALAGFAALGLLLAALGLYSVIANSVVRRTQEIGIRLALGAQVRDILALVLGGGLRVTAIGVSIGLAGALGVARLLGALSPEFAQGDPVLAAGITLLLVAVALFACWLPARRATKVDPMTALRAE